MTLAKLIATPTSIRLPRTKWGSRTNRNEPNELILLAGGEEAPVEGVRGRIVLSHFLADAGEKLLDPRLVRFGQPDELAARLTPALHHVFVHDARLRVDAPLQLVAFLDHQLTQIRRKLRKPRTAHHADR